MLVIGAVKLADMLGVKRHDIYNFIKKDMPVTKKTGRYIFDYEKVIVWTMENNEYYNKVKNRNIK